MFRSPRPALLGAYLALVGCADPATQKRLDDLEAKVAELTKKVEAGGGTAAANNTQSPDEQAAMALYREADAAFKGGKTDDAKQKLDELKQRYGNTRVANAAQHLLDQINVVGKKIDELKVAEWYQGDTTLAKGDATLLVFWEVWCPHCRREVPKLEATYEKYKDKGLNMVGLTKLSRGKTPEELMDFVKEQKVQYPIGKEDGSMSDFFGVSGVPAAAVVKDGEVVWRGHPSQITDDMIAKWLSKSS